jgi:uncharacterized membrane protein
MLWFSIPLSVIAALCIACLYFWIFHGSLSSSAVEWSAFGEYFGGVLGPVIAFLALVVLVMTLQHQIEELALSRTAMEASAKALREQVDISTGQRNDATYFHFLQLYHNTINMMEAPIGANDETRLGGHQLLGDIYRQVGAHVGASSDIGGALLGLQRSDSEYNYALELFTNAVELILEFIKKLPGGERDIYAARFRNQISTPELCLLFYQGLTKQRLRLKDLLEEFQFFQSLPVEALIHAEHAAEYSHTSLPSASNSVSA